jgi:DNA-directed RNA polymerase, alpha subunit/40 kD subunit
MTNLTKKNNLNKILSIKILEEWPLTTRSHNALKDNGIITAQDLIECSENRLLTFRNFGRKGIEEVKNILDSLGLKLGMNLIYDDCLKEKLSENKSNNFTEDIVQNNFPDEILTIDILKEWPLSERSFNVLKRENIIFVGDLLQYDLKELLKFKNFGKNSLKEIKENLSKLDLDKYNINLSNWDDIRQKPYI